MQSFNIGSLHVIRKLPGQYSSTKDMGECRQNVIKTFKQIEVVMVSKAQEVSLDFFVAFNCIIIVFNYIYH